MWPLTVVVVLIHCALGYYLYWSQNRTEWAKEKRWRQRYDWRD